MNQDYKIFSLKFNCYIFICLLTTNRNVLFFPQAKHTYSLLLFVEVRMGWGGLL